MGSVPGEFKFAGKVTIVNENAEPTLCLNIDLDIPKILDEEEELEVEKTCTKTDSDHITNIVTDGDTTTMDLDEDLGYVNLVVDISVKAPVVPAVSLSLAQLPITVSPAFPAG